MSDASTRGIMNTNRGTVGIRYVIDLALTNFNSNRSPSNDLQTSSNFYSNCCSPIGQYLEGILLTFPKLFFWKRPYRHVHKLFTLYCLYRQNSFAVNSYNESCWDKFNRLMLSFIIHCRLLAICWPFEARFDRCGFLASIRSV